MKKNILCCIIISCCLHVTAQTDSTVFFKGCTKENKEKLHRNLINNTINKNLSLPLTDSTEENWTDAFWAMELTGYQSPWADNKIRSVFDSLQKRSADFQKAFIELLYTNYGNQYNNEVKKLFGQTGNATVFSICAEYISKADSSAETGYLIIKQTDQWLLKDKSNPIIQQLSYRLAQHPKNYLAIADLSKLEFFKGAVILVSLQRKNRNFPGMAIIRDSSGQWLKDEAGNIFSVPQLARSVSNLPGYISNGNTPQGIYRMYGMAVSKSNFIGPTPNIQLTMPFETSLQHFFNDSTITDSVWTENWYRKLLPGHATGYYPFYESYYAGKIGRTAIIAHGSTIDPDYYKGQPYYPMTPTQGCLCCKENWSETDGRRISSDQQKLAAAIQKAGGANGYCIVIQIDDQQKPVTEKDLDILLHQ